MDIHDATEQAYKNGYEKGRKDALAEDKCVMPCTVMDYKAEYERKCEELDKACAEADWLRTELKATETEFSRMRAQLDVVYLIFGGQNR